MLLRCQPPMRASRFGGRSSTPKTIREMIDAINEHGRPQAENQASELHRVQ